MITKLAHPLIDIKVSQLRNRDTQFSDFRRAMYQLSALMVYPIMQNYQVKKEVQISATGAQFDASLKENEILLVPILRAGLGMLEAFLDLIPFAQVAHIGLSRNENLEIQEYFYKVPNVSKNAKVIILDPMLATGHSLKVAIDRLKNDGFSNISAASIIAVQEGVDYIEKYHKDVQIYTANFDHHLNEKSYIIPGLGDAGDRLFGEKNSH
ncbi:uracil phosphoribosyltransferase [Mesomycoplasma conjunctivae]